MKNVLVYFGPKRTFLSLLPEAVPWTSLTDLALRSDARQREHVFKMQGRRQNEPEEASMLKTPAPCVVAFSDEYAAISEHAIQGFLAFLSQFEIDELFLQNPPAYLVEQLSKMGKEARAAHYRYRTVDAPLLRRFNAEYDQRIIGQPNAKQQLMTALYPLVQEDRKKPVVLLFYGPTGVGKTETAKLLSEMMGQQLFRKQFSMFHSNDFANYLFGGRHSQVSLAKELMERESNILLFDEFDKPNPLFHSAFYQLFDEGIYNDKNYYVEVSRAVIICTSNYESVADAQMKLGQPLFSRFDAVIRFDELPPDASEIIISNEYNALLSAYTPAEQDVIKRSLVIRDLQNQAKDLCNARQVKRAVLDAFSRVLLADLLNAPNPE